MSYLFKSLVTLNIQLLNYVNEVQHLQPKSLIFYLISSVVCVYKVKFKSFQIFDSPSLSYLLNYTKDKLIYGLITHIILHFHAVRV